MTACAKIIYFGVGIANGDKGNSGVATDCSWPGAMVVTNERLATTRCIELAPSVSNLGGGDNQAAIAGEIRHQQKSRSESPAACKGNFT